MGSKEGKRFRRLFHSVQTEIMIKIVKMERNYKAQEIIDL